MSAQKKTLKKYKASVPACGSANLPSASDDN